MAGRRPRSGTGSARSGPAPGTRRPWSAAARPRPGGGPDGLDAPSAPGAPDRPGAFAPSGRPGALGRPGDPAGHDILGRADVLERAPGRWSPSRLASPPRWLLAVIAVVVLAGGGTAVVAGGLRHAPAQPSRPKYQAVTVRAPCAYIIDPVPGATPAHVTSKTLKSVDCAPPGTGLSRPGSSSICVPLQVEAWHPTTQFGVRHRCYPGLA